MVGLALGSAWAKAPAPRDLPEAAEGTFVQRKILADVDVTLVSKGTFRFGRDRFFEWNTREPIQSVFYATPTNYSLTVNGKTARARDFADEAAAAATLSEYAGALSADPALTVAVRGYILPHRPSREVR